MLRRIIIIVTLLFLAGCTSNVKIDHIPVSELEKGSAGIHVDFGTVIFPNGRNFSEGVSNISLAYHTPDPDWECEWSVEKHVENEDMQLHASTWWKVPFSGEQEILQLENGTEKINEFSGNTFYSHNINLNLNLLAFPLDAGLYRVVLNGSHNNKMVGGFSVGTLEMLDEEDLPLGVAESEIHNDKVRLTIGSPTYSPDVESIFYSYESADGVGYGTGCGASLEKHINGKWYHLYCSGGYEAVKSFLLTNQLMYISSYYFPLTEGKYRIVKGFTSPGNNRETFYASDEFEIVKDSKKPAEADFVTIEFVQSGSRGTEIRITNNGDKKFYWESYVNFALTSRELYTRTHDHPQEVAAHESQVITVQGLDKTPNNKQVISIWLEDGTEYYIDLSKSR